MPFDRNMHAGVGNTDIINYDAEEIKKQIALLEEEKQVLLAKNDILKKSTPGLELISQKQGNEAFDLKVKKLESLRNSIIEYKKNKNRALQRKTINESTLSEINSLMRTPNTGDLYCLDCGSKRIGYSSGDKSYTFDISDTTMRGNIIAAIQDKIHAYQEEIENCTFQINMLQRQMQELLKEEDIGLEHILIYKNSITAITDADTRIAEIDKDIKLLKSQQKNSKQKTKESQGKRDDLSKSIIEKMNYFYKKIDPSGSLVFNDMFAKRSSVYSGCEQTEFYLSKLYALVVVLRHKYPVMMDYFRDGELSTEKEDVVLKEFSKIPNQIIFTATLKEQEMGKYSEYNSINAIDYSVNEDSHILTTEYVEELRKLLKPLMIKI